MTGHTGPPPGTCHCGRPVKRGRTECSLHRAARERRGRKCYPGIPEEESLMTDQSTITLDPAQRNRDLRNEVRRRVAARLHREEVSSDTDVGFQRGQVIPFPTRTPEEPRDAR